MKRLLEIDDCWFYFPDRNGNYFRVEIRNHVVFCRGRHKEIKLLDDGWTDMIEICEMLVNYGADKSCDHMKG